MKKQVAKIFFLLAIFFAVPLFAKAVGSPDYLPDGPHPRIWLTPTRLSELKAKRDASDAEWVNLLAYCEAHKNDTGYDVQYNPASWQSTWYGVPIAQTGSPGGSGYRASGYYEQMINFALCYQIIKDVDLPKADLYAAHGIAVMHGLVNSFSVGEETNGLAIIRVGEREDGSINASEVAAIGIDHGTSNYKQGYSARNAGVGMALAYDWFYDKLTESEKVKFYGTLYRWIDWYRGKRTTFNDGVLIGGVRYYEDRDGDCTGNNVCTSAGVAQRVGYGFDTPASNYYSGYFEMTTLAAMATYDSGVPETQPYLDIAVTESWNNFLKPALISPTRYKGGDSPEGWNYGSGWNRVIRSLYAMDTASGRNEFSGFDFPKEYLNSYMHATAPTLKTMLNHGEWTGSMVGKPYEDFMLAPTYIAKKEYPTDDIGKVGQFFLNNATFAFMAENWQRFLWGDNSSASKDFSGEPLFYRNIGTGLVTMRSSWNNALDSIFASVQLGALGLISHENYDEGNFMLQRGDDKLLIHENMKTASVAHNTIVFNDASHHANNPTLSQPAIDRIEDAANHFFVRSELSNAFKREWNTDKIKHFYRNILYLRPGQFVVYDVTRSNATIGNLKDWYTNYSVDPSVDNVEKTISATVGSSKVHTKTLFPTDGNLTKCTSLTVGNPGYCGSALPGAGYFRVKFTPTVTQEYDQFLHVVQTTGSSDSQVATTLISGVGGRGALIENPTENIVAMFTSNQDGADIANISYSATTTTASKHVIANLVPNQDYNIVVDSGSATLKTSSSAGIIEFSSTPSGAHSYSITTGPADITAPSAPSGLSVM